VNRLMEAGETEESRCDSVVRISATDAGTAHVTVNGAPCLPWATPARRHTATPSGSTISRASARGASGGHVGAAEPLAAPSRARHPLVEKILSGTAPEAIRMTAARGALPLPLQDLVYAQICLLHDELPQVVQAATGSLATISLEALIPLLRDPGCEAVLIDHFVRSGRLTGDALEAAIAHPAVMDATLESAASEGTEEALNLIVTKDVRIIKNPHLLEILRGNPNLSADNRRRLLELERDFVGKEQLRVRPAPAVEPSGPELPGDMLSEGTAEGVPAEGEAPVEGADVPVMPAEEEAQYEE